MKVCFDTSTLIPALVQSHPKHALAFPWLERAKRGEIDGVVSAHTLSELYSYLTGHGKKSPADTKAIFEQDILSCMQVVALTENEYLDMIDRLINLDRRGGIIFDAIHAHVAIKAQVDILLTDNKRDFYRLYPEIVPRITELS